VCVIVIRGRVAVGISACLTADLSVCARVHVRVCMLTMAFVITLGELL